MLLNVILLVVGFVVLIKGADIFVDGASGIASYFKVSKMLIGLTIVAFGTSAPELAVSIKSLLLGSGDIVLGNVIGSNILNILLILGVSSTIHNLSVKNATVKKEIPTLILLTLAFATLLLDSFFDPSVSNVFTRSDGIIILLFFLVFIYYLIHMMRNKIEEDDDNNNQDMPLVKGIAFTVLGIVAIVLGSNFVVESASNIASLLGVSERLIALTIVALGTSLPELVTSAQATKKGEYDIAIGNVVGSNIFNIGIVVGLPVAILGTIPNVTINYLDIIVMIISVILLFIFSFNDRKISKNEGVIFLLIFLIYYSYIILV